MHSAHVLSEVWSTRRSGELPTNVHAKAEDERPLAHDVQVPIAFVRSPKTPAFDDERSIADKQVAGHVHWAGGSRTKNPVRKRVPRIPPEPRDKTAVEGPPGPALRVLCIAERAVVDRLKMPKPRWKPALIVDDQAENWRENPGRKLHNDVRD